LQQWGNVIFLYKETFCIKFFLYKETFCTKFFLYKEKKSAKIFLCKETFCKFSLCRMAIMNYAL